MTKPDHDMVTRSILAGAAKTHWLWASECPDVKNYEWRPNPVCMEQDAFYSRTRKIPYGNSGRQRANMFLRPLLYSWQTVSAYLQISEPNSKKVAGSVSWRWTSLSRSPCSLAFSSAVRSSTDPSSLDAGLGSGDGRLVACRDLNRILLVSSSMSTDVPTPVTITSCSLTPHRHHYFPPCHPTAQHRRWTLTRTKLHWCIRCTTWKMYMYNKEEAKLSLG